MDHQLEKVLAFATEAHGKQRRKFVDEPYINHPVRVMEECLRYSKDTRIAAAALLHDVLEDTKVTAPVMQSFLENVFPHEDARHCMRLVSDLTDIYTHESYPNLNRRARKDRENERLTRAHPDAQTIKYADIIDNCIDITRSGDDFIPRFLLECKAMLKQMPKGHPKLYSEAVATVNLSLAQWEMRESSRIKQKNEPMKNPGSQFVKKR